MAPADAHMRPVESFRTMSVDRAMSCFHDVLGVPIETEVFASRENDAYESGGCLR